MNTGKRDSPGSGDLPATEAPLYARVRRALETLALDRPLNDRTPLPSEPELSKMFEVSRGTLRRAVADLASVGLLRVEQGRGTYIDPEERVRLLVRTQLSRVAYPDSRFDLDLTRFIPDFAGRERCDERIVELADWRDAQLLFITPDNNVEGLRRRALSEGRSLVVPTYGMRRGFIHLDGQRVDTADHGLAATLDGMERVGRRVTLDDIRSLGTIDLLLTGAVAVSSTTGVQVGLAQRYHTIERAILTELNVLSGDTQVIVSAHDCQVLDEPLMQQDSHCHLIVTPTRLISCAPPSESPDAADKGEHPSKVVPSQDTAQHKREESSRQT